MKREKLEKGKWYKDNDGDFIKCYNVTEESLVCSAYVFKSQRKKYEKGKYYLHKDYTYVPMTIDEMKEHLPEEEWWVKESNELFPIY